MKSTCWDTRATDSIIKSDQKDTEASITHVFDNINHSQEIFGIDIWGAVICSLGHDRKHMLMILPTISRPGFT